MLTVETGNMFVSTQFHIKTTPFVITPPSKLFQIIFLLAEEPEPGLDPKCYRANGFFNHEDPTVCTKYYNCVHGYPHAYDCPTPLVFDEAQVQFSKPQHLLLSLNSLNRNSDTDFGRTISPLLSVAGHLCKGGAVLFICKEVREV